MDLIIIIEWLVLSINSLIIEIYLLIDWISRLFIGLVLIITSIVVLYRVRYIKGDKFIRRFLFLVTIFVISILLIILRPRLIRILLGWDLLGLVSYCLVIYYQNYRSYNSGIVTVLSNRIGDVGLLVTIGVIISYGSWNIYIINIDNYIIYLIIILAAITKRAQIPFSTWLPIAIAAPTPVSSLVHSSTLVTAGIYLIIRFNNLIIIRGFNLLLLFISIFTIIIAGLRALYENDLKKIIALSTLSQLGLIIIILRLGLRILGFYHLITHALFKSLLFLCAGIIIHLIKNNQDIRYCGGLNEIIPFISIVFYVSILSIIGCPFLSGFYSKDLIIEFLYIYDFSVSLFIIILFSLSLTVIYSLRLYYYLFFMKNFNYQSVGELKESKLINLSTVLLVIIRIIRGSILNWLFFFRFEGIYLNIIVKFLTIIIIVIGGVLFFNIIIIKIKYIKYLNIFILIMWNLNYIYIWINKKFLTLRRKFNLIDTEWIERVEVNIWDKIKINFINWFYSKFKIYQFINIFIFFVIIIVFIII